MLNTKKEQMVSSTSYEQAAILWKCMILGSTIGLENVEFKVSALCGDSLGCFALKDFKLDDVIFAIPQNFIFSIGNASSSVIAQRLREFALGSCGKSSLVTSELLIWLGMIEHRYNSTSLFAPYFTSLDPMSPSPLSWPEALFNEALCGTNLACLVGEKEKLQRHIEFLKAARKHYSTAENSEEWLPESVFNLENLIWARGHYLARRYPGHFARGESLVDERGKLDGREVGLENLGSLVPLLDVLNHDSSRDWLRLEVKDESLLVICNFAVKCGEELFSNYGSQTNERLIFAYGFSIEDNEEDAVTLRLMLGPLDPSSSSSSSSSSTPPSSSSSSGESSAPRNLGTFYIQRGGLQGVPAELWLQLSKFGEEEGEEEEEEVNGNSNSRSINSSNSNISGEKDGVEEVEEENEVEIGLDEVLLLRDFLQHKMRQLEASDHR